MAEKTTVPVKTEGRLARREPFEFLNEMQQDLARFWSEPWALTRPFRRLFPREMMWMPRTDVFEQDATLIVKAEIPGVKKEDIEVSLDDGDLVIKGERKAETEIKEENYYRMERSYGSFYRCLPLPFETKAEQIEAHFEDGVLEVRIPKPAEAKVEPKKITVA